MEQPTGHYILEEITDKKKNFDMIRENNKVEILTEGFSSIIGQEGP